MAETMRVSFNYGSRADLPGEIKAGNIHIVEDDKAIYVDLSDSQRIRIGNFVEVDSIAAAEALPNPSTNAFYYIRSSNILLEYDDSTTPGTFKQVNVDTGAIAGTATGDGNALTAVGYNAATRTMEFTKGETFATKQELDDLSNEVTGDLAEAIEAETNARKEADDAINTAYAAAVAAAEQNAATALSDVKNAIANDISNEANVRSAADTAINGVISTLSDTVNGVKDDLSNDISNEVTARTNADDALRDKINGVETNATQALSDAKNAIANDISNEANTRSAADDAINEALTGAVSDLTNAYRDADNSVKETLIGDATNDTAVANTIAGAKKYADSIVGNLANAIEVRQLTQEEGATYAAVYQLYINNTPVAVPINIPKDMVVKEGSVVKDPEGQEPGTYIKLVLANATEDEIYIKVDDLIEYVTSGSLESDAIQITVSDDHKVSASVKTGSITETMLAATFVQKVTDVVAEVANIKDDTDLDSFKDVHDALNAAANATTELANKISDEENARKAADDAINTAYTSAIATAEQNAATALSDKANDITNAYTNAVANAESNASAALSDAKNAIANDISNEANARTTADDAINTAYAAAVAGAETNATNALNDAKNAIANDISNETNARATADDAINTAYTAAIANAESNASDALNDAVNALANDIANEVSDREDAINAVIGDEANDTYDSDTIEGAKKYVEYLLTWHPFTSGE